MNGEKTLRIHQVVNKTRANGPGTRVAIWVQGCTLGCPGCFNPGTHPKAGMEQTVGQVIQFLKPLTEDPSIEGITISGGEPLQQWDALSEILFWVKNATNWSVVVFTGFEPGAELVKHKGIDQIESLVDVLIAGRYRQDQRLADRLIGSYNKRMLFYSGRYTPEDFENIPTAELRIKDGKMISTGINPVIFPTKVSAQ